MTVRCVARPAPGFDATVVLPGSKSITNRALVCASLASGRSTLIHALDADDTVAMRSCLRELGASIDDGDADRWVVSGPLGRAGAASSSSLFVNESGTTARFVTPLCLVAPGDRTIDAASAMRARPMSATFDALRALGAEVASPTGGLPARIVTGTTPVDGRVVLGTAGAVSSQFLSGLMMAGAALPGGLRLTIGVDRVSTSYVDMTASVMRDFGATVEVGERDVVVAGTYRAVDRYLVEPDASAASYFLAAAALCGGTVRIPGLVHGSIQGDVRFADILARMGATVRFDEGGVAVSGSGRLHGVDVDMSDVSDTAQTLAAIAPFADGPTTVRGIGFIRAKETDRIAAVVTELRRCGVVARETDDGFVIEPGRPTAARVETYGDHRMAMSFAVMALVTPGLEISDPECVAKTFPAYWDVLDSLAATP